MNDSIKNNSVAIRIKNLTVQYKDSVILNNIDLNLNRGSVYGLIGPTGCGKTTLFKTLIGLINPAQGEVVFEDCLSSDDFNIGYMPQTNALYEELTVIQHLNFFASMYGINDNAKKHEAVQNIMHTVSLENFGSRKIAKLSGGEKQRVSLGIAMIHSPKILILDEPTVGLDPKLRNELWSTFGELSKNGTTILISSHTLDDAKHCYSLSFMYRGSIITTGTPKQLCAQAGESEDLEAAFLYYCDKLNNVQF